MPEFHSHQHLLSTCSLNNGGRGGTNLNLLFDHTAIIAYSSSSIAFVRFGFMSMTYKEICFQENLSRRELKHTREDTAFYFIRFIYFYT